MSSIYRTVGEIKERLKDVPDDYDIRYARIEDIYFKEYGWDNPEVSKKMIDVCCCREDEHDEHCYSDYVGIFTVIVNDEEKCVQLTAHY